MTGLSVEIHFNSVSEFEAVYRLVKEEVLAFDSLTGTILAANDAFKKSRGSLESASNVKDLFVFPFTAEGTFEQPGNGSSKDALNLSFNISIVQLAGQEVKMLFVLQQPSVALEGKLLLVQAEKKALLNEVYHRVKNNLNIIVSLLSLQTNRVTEPYTRHLLLESKSRIYTLSLLQQKLYSSTRLTEIKAGNYLQSLALSVISTFKPPGKDLHLVAEVEEEWLNIDTLMPIGLITHELVSNAVLHAFVGQEQGQISICFRKTGSDLYLLKVADNGIGLTELKKPEDYNSLGFQLVKSLLKQLKTQWKVESSLNSGTCYSFEFKEIHK